MSQNINLARAFKPKDAFGQPKAVLAAMPKDGNGLPIEGSRHVIGYIFGTAEKAIIKTRPRPDGGVDEFPALEGNFEGMPTDDKLPTTRAPLAYLPPHIHSAIANQLKSGAVNVGFAFEVIVVAKASSSAGFVWEYVAKGETQTVDPLAELRARALGLPAPSAPQIEDQSDEGPNEPRSESHNEVEDEAPAKSRRAKKENA